MAAKSVEKSADKSAADAKIAATRTRELDAAISSITKSYGEGAIMRLGDAQAHVKIEVIPTGALALDLALGVGGIPRRARGGNLRAGIFGQNNLDAPRHRQCAKSRWTRGVH
ncbi:MAG: hypothetical protein WDM76_13655 [Limisphaerales bacterium]